MKRAAVALVLCGCSPAAPPAAPPPATASTPVDPTNLGPVIAASAAAVVPSAEPVAAPPEPKGPVVHIEIEPPFRLDKRVVPQERTSFLENLRDRERWNRGGLGELVKPAPDVAGHPLPKVIVDVTKAKGPHSVADLQRVARKMFWSHVVTCYGLGAYKDQKLRGTTTLRFSVSRAGKVGAAKVVKTTLKDADVAACLADEIRKIEFPKAKAGSIVTSDVQIGPGDEPVAPPAKIASQPGDGTIDSDAVADVVRAALPDIERCYVAALDYAPALWGRLGVRFHQTDKGRLDEAFEVESRFPDERVTLCVLHVARGLTFAKPKGGDVRFTVPLRFSTERAPGPPTASETSAPAVGSP